MGMHRVWLGLVIAAASYSGLVLASSDESSCAPVWSVFKTGLDACNSLPFLSPGNDNRVNFRLLLADAHALAVVPQPVAEEDAGAGYAQVPFPLSRLAAPPVLSSEAPAGSDTTPQRTLKARADQLGVPLDSQAAAGDGFLGGEGSRCRSNSDISAAAFLDQLIASQALSVLEKQSLAQSRLVLLSSCDWPVGHFDAKGLQSPEALQFASYLQASADFYSGRFDAATQGFVSLADSPQAWLKATALYMQGRTALNLAQQHAFDSEGMLTNTPADPEVLHSAQTLFAQYLQAYPQGEYAASAQGLLRRIHWLGNQPQQLADDYLWQLDPAHAGQRNVEPDELIDEADSKLLSAFGPQAVQSAQIVAVLDLMQMRHHDASVVQAKVLSWDDLRGQQRVFSAQPALFAYLQAVFQLYVAHQPDAALQLLPSELPEHLDYFAFSQQTVRGFALEAKGDNVAAAQLWLRLLARVDQPLQHGQLQLALALNYQRSQQLDKVFAADSPILTPQLRDQLLDSMASAELLRQQVATSKIPKEADIALFVLLYKDLLYGHYDAFVEDMKLLPAQPSSSGLGFAIGYDTPSGPGLSLFRWTGQKAASGYGCPSIGETAGQLRTDPHAPMALNCLSEFVLRNNLDDMPLSRVAPVHSAQEVLGSGESQFKGSSPAELFARHSAYQQVIADPHATDDDKAYALYRVINCYSPSGNNACGGAEVERGQRKQWFKTLKTAYAGSQWAKSLKYYW